MSSIAFLGIDFPAIVAEALDGVGSPPSVLWPDDVEDLHRSDDARPSGAIGADEDRATDGDLAVAFTTSGTTGRPKLAAHDHASTVRHLRVAATSLATEPESVTLVTVPFCGTFGFVSLLAALGGGGRVVLPARFEAREAAALVADHGVTHVNASDDMLLAMMAPGADLSSWRHGVFAEFTGRGLECARAAQVVGARLTGVYGSSETFALLARRPEPDPLPARARSGGRFLDHAHEVRAVDPTTGAVLPPGDAGELQVRGPSVLAGYLDGAEIQPPPLTADGWFPTGDLGFVEPDGGFVYEARLGDALRLTGFLTDPAEIEQRLLGHPAVTGAQVVGVPGPTGGEVAVAFVTVGEPERAAAHGSPHGLEAELVEHCRAGLANYKVPTSVVVIDEFPTIAGANGVKIRKTELRARAALLVERDPGRSTSAGEPQRS